MTHDSSALLWLIATGALLALLAGVCWFLVLTRLKLQQAKLQAMQREQSALVRLLDSWHWRSDAQHHLTESTPPRGQPPQALPSADRLWDWLHCPRGTLLQVSMEAHNDLPDTVVQGVSGQAPQSPMTLRATALRDARGKFSGYVGILVPIADSPNTFDERSDQASFSYTVSHDLRAPIRVVEGFARILKEDYGRLLDRVGNDHLDRILSAAGRMNRMIDSLLSLSQLSCAPLQNEPVNLSQLAALVIDDLRRQSSPRDVQVHIEPDLMAQGDPTLLRIALDNLLGNAWKYTSKTPNATISFSRAPQDSVFRIGDNGAGFDMRFADRLFGVFQRLHGANDFQGSGVGLATVRRIIRRHGGDIWARGEVNQGAEFHFSLPDSPGQIPLPHP